jgi:hypothetical protein
MAPPLLVLSAIDSNNRTVAIKQPRVQRNSSELHVVTQGDKARSHPAPFSWGASSNYDDAWTSTKRSSW